VRNTEGKRPLGTQDVGVDNIEMDLREIGLDIDLA
jgi:hypothetical protein